jgi:hypothetical protein
MKLLMIQKCAVPTIDGPAHIAANTLVDIDVDAARALVQAGRALYIDPKDDPSRAKVSVAPEARVEALRKALKSAAKGEQAPAA